MAYFDQSYQTKEVADFLVQVRKQGTPLRVESENETYYLLTANQLQQLLLSTLADNPDAADFSDTHTFTPEEFGLTEAAIAAYEANQQKQRAALPLHRQQPPDPELIRRLDTLPRLERLFPQRAAAEREALLRELEIAMLNRLQSLIPETE